MEENPLENASAAQEVAGFGRRFLAYFLDFIVLVILFSPVNMVFRAGTENTDSFNLSVSLINLAISAAYFIFFWVKQDGQTIGKRVMALKVIKVDKSPIDVTTGIVRYIGYLISSSVLGLGFIWIIFDKKKQGWHDKIAKTLVVKTGQKVKKGIVVVVLLLAFILIGVMILGFYFLFQNEEVREASFKDFEKEVSKSIPFTQEEANMLASDVFQAVNEYRQEEGLTPYPVDTNLCAYAQRRLDQLSTLGRLDDHKGFIEDTADAQVTRAYFKNFLKTGEIYRGGLTSLTTDAEIINGWKAGEVNYSISERSVGGDLYNQACARANTDFLILIVAESK